MSAATMSTPNHSTGDTRETAIIIAPYGDLVQLEVSTNSDPNRVGCFIGAILKVNPGLLSGCRILLKEDFQPGLQ